MTSVLNCKRTDLDTGTCTQRGCHVLTRGMLSQAKELLQARREAYNRNIILPVPLVWTWDASNDETISFCCCEPLECGTLLCVPCNYYRTSPKDSFLMATHSTIFIRKGFFLMLLCTAKPGDERCLPGSHCSLQTVSSLHPSKLTLSSAFSVYSLFCPLLATVICNSSSALTTCSRSLPVVFSTPTPSCQNI